MSVGRATLFFAVWLSVLVVLKELILEEYHVSFSGFSGAIIGALILAKVVLVLEHVPVAPWLRWRPAWMEWLFRTALYAAGVVVVLLLEKAFEARHEHGGFVESLTRVLDHPEMPHVWANAITVGGALLLYNAVAIIERRLGGRTVTSIFLEPARDAHPDNRGVTG